MKNPPHVDSLCVKGRGEKIPSLEADALFLGFWVLVWFGIFFGGVVVMEIRIAWKKIVYCLTVACLCRPDEGICSFLELPSLLLPGCTVAFLHLFM